MNQIPRIDDSDIETPTTMIYKMGQNASKVTDTAGGSPPDTPTSIFKMASEDKMEEVKFDDKDYLKAIGEEPVVEKPNTTII